MPKDSMPAPHYPQSKPGACLPACARMVLAALGRHYSEAELAQVMESYSFGTPASRVTRLQSLGYHVRYATMTAAELWEALEEGTSPIVFVWADFLPWADFTGFHALVLVDLTDTHVWLHDPALEDGPTQLSIDGFLLAWEEFDRKTAVITL
jgi:ABC-type bacteriocin/lantibiotic exporter with double-glycine peptidase domain